MQPTVDQHVVLEPQFHDNTILFYLDDFVRFPREAPILSGLEELLERGALVVI